MTDGNDRSRKTYDRIKALDMVLSEMDAEEADAGTCPKCGGELVGYRRKNAKSREGVVRCRSCGYFYVVRE